MNIDYISGFFDADGYVTLSKNSKSDIAKSPIVGFTNNEKGILLEIQSFLLTQFEIKGFISFKRKRNPNHQDGYDLKYSYDQAIRLLEVLQTRHPFKHSRKQLICLEYKLVVKRNGKYSIVELDRLSDFEKRFFEI